METIRVHDVGAAVEDVQRKLCSLGYLAEDAVTSSFDEETVKALAAFCRDNNLEPVNYVDQIIWSRLVDASYQLGDRNLYLRIPFFHGHDVLVLQQALGILGFATGETDGIFGPHTEEALRRFQMNMGLPSDGIVGSLTFTTLNNLSHSWRDKSSIAPIRNMNFSRAAEALEKNMLCLYGTQDFTRLIASRMSNLAMATNPHSKVASADTLLVNPEMGTVFFEILGADQKADPGIPTVTYDPVEMLPVRLATAFQIAGRGHGSRVAVRIPGETWREAGEDRSAQHFAIVLLDAICSATLLLEE